MIRFTEVTSDDKKKEAVKPAPVPAIKTAAPVEEPAPAKKPAAKRKIANPVSKKAAAKG